MADISNVITVNLFESAQLAQRDNMNVVMIITSELGKLSSANRVEAYRDISGVANDFGTNSKAYSFAKTFFGQQPNPIGAGGLLYLGYWRAVDETVAATSAILSGGQLSEAVAIGELQTVSDGNLSIDVDGVTQDLNGLDFRTVLDFAGILSVINAAITGATATEDDQKIVITSDTTGASSTLTLATDTGVGTFVGDILNLSAGSGAIVENGAASTVLTAESKEDAAIALKALVNFKGSCFIDNPTDVESLALASWAQANSTIMYDVFDSPSNLEVDETNVVWQIKLAGYSNYRMLYSKSGNRHFAAAYMSRNHVVNFSAENSALTMNLKELNVSAESYTESEVTKAKNVGLDIYTTIKLVPRVLTSGANDFVDNVYNLIAYIDAVETDSFNFLSSTATKIAQTTEGVDSIVDSIEKTTGGFVNAGVFAAGTWTLPDTFGDPATFHRNIEENGFYVLAGELKDQPQSERQGRGSSPIMTAVKNKGAIHKANVIIIFNI